MSDNANRPPTHIRINVEAVAPTVPEVYAVLWQLLILLNTNQNARGEDALSISLSYGNGTMTITETETKGAR